MKIIESDFFWNGVLSKRALTKYIVLHHRAGEGDAESIHSQHLSQGWDGIGYHFYIRKNGEVYRGRPIDKIGAHTQGSNSCSVGICFEGNYETDKEMPKAQLEAGQELVSYIKKLYPGAEVKGHRDLQSTACPGKNFPFKEITEGEDKDAGMIVYNTVKDCPVWAQSYVEKAESLGWIRGNEKGQLKLNDDKIWMLVVLLRAQGIMN